VTVSRSVASTIVRSRSHLDLRHALVVRFVKEQVHITCHPGLVGVRGIAG